MKVLTVAAALLAGLLGGLSQRRRPSPPSR